MRKTTQGSILIEVLGSIIMLTITTAFIVSVSLKCNNQYKNRVKEEKINRIVNSVIKELKYNTTQYEVDSMFDENEKFGLKYRDDFLERVCEIYLYNLEKGNDIVIEKISDEKYRQNYKVTVDVVIDDYSIKKDYEFYKSWWMDEI